MEDESAESVSLSNVGETACQLDQPNPTHRGDIKNNTTHMLDMADNDATIAEAKGRLRRHGD